MQSKSPFLPGFPTLLCGSAKSSLQGVLRSKVSEIKAETPGDLSCQFAEEIPADFLHSLSETKRDRIYNNVVVFWAFLGQVIAEDSSCKRAVARVRQWYRKMKLKMPSADTTSYCEARLNLPVSMLKEVNRKVYTQLDEALPEKKLWRGYRVKAVDGTSTQLPDTEANQAQYPQPPGQAEGCGFPVMKLGSLIDLGHGGMPDVACGSLDTSEQKCHKELEACLGKGDVLVADRLYSSYEIIWKLRQKEVEYIGRHHQARKVDFRKGKKIGPNERLVTWTKPGSQHPGSCLTKEQWAQMDREMQVRVIRTKGPGRDGKHRTIYVVTTLLDANDYPADEVGSLYFHRWEIEVRFRDIKTMMKMEMLRTKTPAMARKEVLMYMIAYNLIRLTMLKAGLLNDINHRRLSFKGAIQVIDEMRVHFFNLAGSRSRLIDEERESMFSQIAELFVKERPGRNEPRVKKKRDKRFDYMTRPRHEYFEHFTSENPPEKILDQEA